MGRIETEKQLHEPEEAFGREKGGTYSTGTLASPGATAMIASCDTLTKGEAGEGERV